MKTACFILFMFFSSSVDAYRFLYDPVAKLNRDTPIYYNPAGAPISFPRHMVRDALAEVIADWNAQCNVRLVYGGGTSALPGDDDDLFVVGWDPIDWDAAAYVEGTAEINSAGQWRIVDADVFLDPAKIHSIRQLKQLLLHELGHVLGLNHSEYSDAVMSGPPFSWYNTLENLTPDDVQGCRALYGR